MSVSSSANAATAFPNILSNIATVTVAPIYVDTNPENNTGQSDLTFGADVQFKISKTDKSETYTPGKKGQYVITIANGGATNANATISDKLPEGVTILGAVACIAADGAVCGKIIEGGAEGDVFFTMAGATIPGSGKGTITITVDVLFASSMTTPEVTNVATVVDPQSNVTAEAKDDILDKYAPKSDLSITKEAMDTITYTPGGKAVYKLVVNNAGPSDAYSALITDKLPAGATLAGAWSCEADLVGSTCGATTGGTVGELGLEAKANIVNGGTITFLVPVQFNADMSVYADTAAAVFEAEPTTTEALKTTTTTSTLLKTAQ